MTTVAKLRQDSLLEHVEVMPSSAKQEAWTLRPMQFRDFATSRGHVREPLDLLSHVFAVTVYRKALIVQLQILVCEAQAP